jgi:hypothetical protein
MATKYRAQILLEPQQHDALTEIARSEGVSISGVVREAVGRYLAERERTAQARMEIEAIEALAEIRGRIRGRHGVVSSGLLAEAREEREQERERLSGSDA